MPHCDRAATELSNRIWKRFTLCLAVWAVGTLCYVPAEAAPPAYETPLAPQETALDRYVAQPDPAYGFEVLHVRERDGVVMQVLELVSQSWRTEAEVRPVEWRHWLTIVHPKEVAHRTSLLFITGGSQQGDSPKRPESALVQVAMQTRSVVAELRMVPNQPLHFAAEATASEPAEGRYEDAIIAYSWTKYLETGDEAWVVQLPMVKSAVRAMDAVQAHLGSKAGGGFRIDDFVVCGASKRGWTTWLTAAVDPRVRAIVPIVIDMLNMVPSFQHHWGAYGFWAPAIRDYADLGLTDPVFEMSDAYEKLVALVDPYAYRKRLTMPKFLLNASQDEFFLPDSAQFYWEGLEGPKHLRYLPNVGHGMGDGSDAIESLAVYYAAILRGLPLPSFQWARQGDFIDVQTEQTPRSVTLWTATNPDARDFRTVVREQPWTATPLTEAGAWQYLAPVSTPQKGWTAHFVELEFDSAPGLPPFTFTTQVYVLPDTLPFADKPPAHE